MSRRNYTHTMDAFIRGNRGYSNFDATFTPSPTPMSLLESRYASTPTAPLFTTSDEPTTIEATPTPSPTPTPTPTPINTVQSPTIAPTTATVYSSTSDEIISGGRATRNATPTTTTTPTVATTYTSGSDEIIMGGGTGTSISRTPSTPTPTPTPVINIITTPVLASEPIAVTPAPVKGSGKFSGGFGGGGGGMASSDSKPKATNVATKPSFLKKNWLPIVLVFSAIYVYVKKPI